MIQVLHGVVDGYPNAVHKVDTSIGGEPLEDGREITDHAVARQDKLTLTGWVSDLNGGERQKAAWDAIRKLHKDVEPIPVATEWGDYMEMIVARAEAQQVSRGMRFTVELVEILRVGVVDNELPDSQTDGPAQGRAGQVDRGRVSLPAPSGDSFAVF